MENSMKWAKIWEEKMSEVSKNDTYLFFYPFMFALNNLLNETSKAVTLKSCSPKTSHSLSIFCVRCPKAAEMASREIFSTGQWTWRAQMRVLGHLFTFLVSPGSVLWQRFPPHPPRGLQSIKYTYLWSEKFSMATENFEMPFFYFIPKVLKICLYSSQSWHIIGYDLIFIALDMFIHIITLWPMLFIY